MADSVGRSGGTRPTSTWGDASELSGAQAAGGPKLTCDPEDSLASADSSADDWTDGAAYLVGQTSAPPRVSVAANNNAQRSGAAAADLFYGDAGFTSSGDSAYAGVAVLKGQRDGATFEVASVSAQVGEQHEVQGGVARASIAFGDSTTCELRAGELELHLGKHNPDGSEGVNFGGGFSGVTAECTVTASGNSLTLGLSASESAELSLGVRDSDSDGRREYCARVAAEFFVAGACVELESAVDVLRDLYSDSPGTPAQGESR